MAESDQSVVQAAPGGYRRIQGDVLYLGAWEFHPLPVFLFEGKEDPALILKQEEAPASHHPPHTPAPD